MSKSWYEPAAVDVAHLKWLDQTAEDVLEPDLPISERLHPRPPRAPARQAPYPLGRRIGPASEEADPSEPQTHQKMCNPGIHLRLSLTICTDIYVQIAMWLS